MKIDQAVLTKALEWSYEKALNGGGPFGSAYQLADEYLGKSISKEAAVDSLINWQIAKCATSGFVTGLGGLISLPVAIPANISSVFLLQLRMIVAIAIIGGFDPKTDQVKSLSFVCLTGNSSSIIFNEIGIKAGQQITNKTIQSISEQVRNRINQLVKIRLLTKTGRIGFVRFGKVVPLVGGVIGGAIDASSTKAIGKVAKQAFVGRSAVDALE